MSPFSGQVWQPSREGKVILCAAVYTDNLKEREVLVEEGKEGRLPGVEEQQRVGVGPWPLL
jgi:hypothetical protein